MVTMNWQVGQDTYSIDNIAGFKICTALDAGLKSTFHVHVLLWDNIQNPFNKLSFPKPLLKAPYAPRGELILADKNFSYTFTNIDWICKTISLSQSYRIWLLTFRYDGDIMNPGKNAVNFISPVQLKNTKPTRLDPDDNRTKYQFQIGKAKEKPILGFQSIQDPNRGNIYRFISYRDENNSWLQELLNQNEYYNKNQQVIQGFEVTLNEHELQIQAQNNPIVYYEETFGFTNSLAYYPLSKLIHPNVVDDIFNVEIEALLHASSSLFDNHNVQHDKVPPQPQSFLETAVVLFCTAGYSSENSLI